MKNNGVINRLWVGAVVLVVLLVGEFNLILPVMHTWGAAEAEVEAVYPGDEILQAPILNWTHAATVQAPAETVWPWIAQLGDTQGAFYSFMFIENLFVGEDRKSVV